MERNIIENLEAIRLAITAVEDRDELVEVMNQLVETVAPLENNPKYASNAMRIKEKVKMFWRGDLKRSSVAAEVTVLIDEIKANQVIPEDFKKLGNDFAKIGKDLFCRAQKGAEVVKDSLQENESIQNATAKVKEVASNINNRVRDGVLNWLFADIDERILYEDEEDFDCGEGDDESLEEEDGCCEYDE